MGIIEWRLQRSQRTCRQTDQEKLSNLKNKKKTLKIRWGVGEPRDTRDNIRKFNLHVTGILGDENLWCRENI